MINEDLINELPAGISYKNDASLATYSSFKVGGSCPLFINCPTSKLLIEIINILDKYSIKFVIIGEGTNILVSDDSDSNPTTAPTIESNDEDTDTAGDFTTTDTSLTIAGTFDASDYAGGFTVSHGGTTFTLGTDIELVANGNNWTLTYPFAASTGSIIATATDAGGNQSSATQLLTVNSTDVDGEKLDVSNHQIGQTYHLEYIKDYDGHLHGNTGTVTDSSKNAYKYQGKLDVNNDGVLEAIYTNKSIGRWATGTVDSLTGEIDYSDHGENGGTRVVGIYDDPLIAEGESNGGFLSDGITPAPANFGVSDEDRYVQYNGERVDRLALNSQVRFQNDLEIDNLAVKASGDYDGDGLQEVYWKTVDDTAYLRALMHADGNIQYANYQNEEQMIDYLTSNGNESAILGII